LRRMRFVVTTLLVIVCFVVVNSIQTYSKSEQLILEAYNWPASRSLSVMLLNVGSIGIDLARAATPIVPDQTVAFSVPPKYDYYFRLELDTGEMIAFSFKASSWRGTDDIGFTLINSVDRICRKCGMPAIYLGADSH
jgi:hypothetical protein